MILDDFVKKFSVSLEFDNYMQEWDYDCSYFDSIEAVKENLALDFPEEIEAGEITITIDEMDFATTIPLNGERAEELAEYVIDAVGVFRNGN